MKQYKLAPHVTEQDLLNNYFDDEQKPVFIRGDEMGWVHQVNLETKEVKYVDEEYAKKYEKLGGLKMFIQDLIDKGIVVEIENKRNRTQASNTYKKSPEYVEKLETLLGLYRDYFFAVEQKYNLNNSENVKTELAVKIKELEREIEK